MVLRRTPLVFTSESGPYPYVLNALTRTFINLPYVYEYAGAYNTLIGIRQK